MKALKLLKQNRKFHLRISINNSITRQYDKAIEELEDMQKYIAGLEEYVQFARNNLESYRCTCGSLGKVGYLCSNEECTEI